MSTFSSIASSLSLLDVEYKDGTDIIPSNASVIVSRRLRGSFESLTPSSHQKPVMSFDETVKEYVTMRFPQTGTRRNEYCRVLLPALAQSTASVRSAFAMTNVERLVFDLGRAWHLRSTVCFRQPIESSGYARPSNGLRCPTWRERCRLSFDSCRRMQRAASRPKTNVSKK